MRYVVDGVRERRAMAGLACGITSADVLKCWGYNDEGFLGDGTRTNRLTPVVIDGGTSYANVNGQIDNQGVRHTCGVTVAGLAKCWGTSAGTYQLGDGASLIQATSYDPGESYQSVAVGYGHHCAINSNGELICWGSNTLGQMGEGASSSQYERTLLKQIDTGVTYRHVSTSKGYAGWSQAHTCGVTISGILKCWGTNEGGQLGDGTDTDRLNPTVVDSSTRYHMVETGFAHTCGITDTGVLKCWGYNWSGQLGDGTQTERLVPVVIDSGTKYKSLSLATEQSCGVTSTGVLKCWGENWAGQIGDGTQVDKLSPTVIDSGTNYISVSTSVDHTCAVTAAGVMKCWGSNYRGQIGDGTNTNRLVPTVVCRG